MGQRCAFLRLGGCNLTCRWCDTPYTWDWRGQSETGIRYSSRDELHPTQVSDVVRQLVSFDVSMVVITGGEPLNQQRRLVPVVHRLLDLGIRIEIETNGTVSPMREIVRPGVRFNVSPKLSNAGMPLSRRIRPDALRSLLATRRAVFKFVCAGEADLTEVHALEQEFGLTPIWIMPLGRTVQDLTRHLGAVADGAVQRGWNLTTRLHVLAWRDERGR